MPNFFYFDQNYQKQGPVSEERLRELAAQGLITPNSPVESDTGHKGVAGQLPSLTFGTAAPTPSAQPTQTPPPPVKPAPAVSSNPGVVSAPSGAATIRKLKTYFVMSLLCLMLGIPLLFAWGLGAFLLIASFIYWCKLLYELWKLIPSDIARTTPGKAVGFLFIPLFVYYWCFVSLLGLCNDLEKVLQQRGIQYQINKGLGKALCVLICCTIFDPLITFGLVSLTCIIIGFLFIKSVMGGAVALLEQGGT